jgi:hypothetical protein
MRGEVIFTDEQKEEAEKKQHDLLLLLLATFEIEDFFYCIKLMAAAAEGALIAVSMCAAMFVD